MRKQNLKKKEKKNQSNKTNTNKLLSMDYNRKDFYCFPKQKNDLGRDFCFVFFINEVDTNNYFKCNNYDNN